MICVTGAGGTVGGEVARQLLSSQSTFRALFFSADKADAARAGGTDAVVVDYRRTESLRDAFSGADKLFLLGPNVLDQVQLECNAVAAAKAAGIRHIVKLSVFDAAGEAYSLATVHREVERAIESSGLAWTFLRPSSFMQNLANFLGPSIRSDAAFYTASGDGRVGHIDVVDIAAAAVQALTTQGHEGKTYTLTGPEALSYDEIAGRLSSVLGRPIEHKNLLPNELRGGMLAAGMPEALVDVMLDLERYIREGNASLITNDVRELTGRDPRYLSDYLRDAAAAGTWDVGPA